MKQVTVFFDLEAWWEAPYRGKFDIEQVMASILDVLDKHHIDATFNTCGIVAEHFPKMVQKAYEKGHEISCHGFKHENFSQMTLEEATGTLAKAEEEIKKAIGHKPEGIRFPWMFYNSTSYKALEKRGYKWASNRHTSFPETFSRPDFHSLSHRLAKSFFSLSAFSAKKAPYKNGSIIEIPVLSSSDGDLLSLVSPEQDSLQEFLDYAFIAWKRQYAKSGQYFNLNFHPWLIGSSNRIQLLEKILRHLDSKRAEDSIRFETAADVAGGEK